MHPQIKIAAVFTPDGGKMELYRHDRDFMIRINGEDLMHSRQHESELALARLGCAHLAACKAPSVLVGGLGMGYTLRQVLELTGPGARVEVAELLQAVVEWNRDHLGQLNGRPLDDPRVEVHTGDIVDLIAHCRHRFDARLLDIDNGPNALTAPGNRRLYGLGGIDACRRALRKQGCLAVWSSVSSKAFEQRLMQCGFHVRRFRVPRYKGVKAQSCFVWVAAEDPCILPSGGGVPYALVGNASREMHRPSAKRPWPLSGSFQKR